MQSKYMQPDLTAIVQDLELCMRECLIKFVRSVSELSPRGGLRGEKKGFESHPFMTSRGITFLFPYINSLPSSILPPILSPSHSLSPLHSLPSSFPLFLSKGDWLLGPAPGAETLANSVALHCVGWKKRPSCEVSVRPRLINEQTGRQSGPSLVFLSWINEAFLKDTPHCSSHWSNIPQHLTLPNFL